MPTEVGPIPYPDHCVYFLYKNNRVVYVGQSTAGLSRLQDHRTRKGHIKDFDAYSYIACTKEELDELEAFHIRRLQPKYNKRRYYFRRNKEIRLDPDKILGALSL